MTITLNGEPHELDDAVTIDRLLESLDYGDRKVAIAINQEFVPRSAYAGTHLNDGDDVEIVAPMPGG